MNKLISIILLTLSVSVFAQNKDIDSIWTVGNDYTMLQVDDSILVEEATAPVSTSFSDDFNSYSSGTLLTTASSDWVSAGGANGITCSGTAVYPNTSGDQVVYVNKTYNNNQKGSAQLITLSSTSRGMGIAFCIQDNNNFYAYRIEGGTGSLIKVVSGTETVLALDYTVDDDETFAFERDGTTIRCYKNGSLNTNLSGGTGTFTDSDLTGGRIGIWGSNNSSNITLDNFSCDNL